MAIVIVALGACGDAADPIERSIREVSGEAEPEPTVGMSASLLDSAYARAAGMPRLYSLLVARDGELIREDYFNGAARDDYANIKSASKSVLSALIGIAIEEGHIDVDQPIAPFFAEYLQDGLDPAKREITVGNLLSMQSGLQSTSFGNYGEWVSSPNWVRYAIRQPMVGEPGGRMLYSTGSSHLLSSILTDATGSSTLSYAREKLAEPLGIELPAWTADPQGIYFGGNEMSLRPLDMLRFGELYRQGGRWEGERVLPEQWIETSWEPRTSSAFNRHRYGYGWWSREHAGHVIHFAWGYGGQFIFIVPDLDLVAVTTSNPNVQREGGHLREVHRLVDQWVIPAAEQGSAETPSGQQAAGMGFRHPAFANR